MSRRRKNNNKNKNKTKWGLKPIKDPWHVGDSWNQSGSRNKATINYGIDETGKCKYDASGRLKLKYPRYCQQGARMSFDIKNDKKKNTNENEMYRQYAALSSFGRKYSAKERLRGEGLQLRDFKRYTQQKRNYLPSSTRTLQSYRFRTGERKALKWKKRFMDKNYDLFFDYDDDDYDYSYQENEKKEEKTQNASEVKKKESRSYDFTKELQNKIKNFVKEKTPTKKDKEDGRQAKHSITYLGCEIILFKNNKTFDFNKNAEDGGPEFIKLDTPTRADWDLFMFRKKGNMPKNRRKGICSFLLCESLKALVASNKIKNNEIIWVNAEKIARQKIRDLSPLVALYKNFGFEFVSERDLSQWDKSLIPKARQGFTPSQLKENVPSVKEHLTGGALNATVSDLIKSCSSSYKRKPNRSQTRRTSKRRKSQRRQSRRRKR